MLKPTIKLRVREGAQPSKMSLTYQFAVEVLTKLSSDDGFVDRATLIEALERRFDELGKTVRNLPATISSLCAIEGIEAVIEHPGGFRERFESKRTLARKDAPDAGAPGQDEANRADALSEEPSCP